MNSTPNSNTKSLQQQSSSNVNITPTSGHAICSGDHFVYRDHKYSEPMRQLKFHYVHDEVCLRASPPLPCSPFPSSFLCHQAISLPFLLWLTPQEEPLHTPPLFMFGNDLLRGKYSLINSPPSFTHWLSFVGDDHPPHTPLPIPAVGSNYIPVPPLPQKSYQNSHSFLNHAREGEGKR
jgi:hypothetical protein